MIASRARYDCAIVMLYLGLNSVVSRRLDFKPESLCHLAFNTLKPRQKWPPFRRRYFQTHFLEWKCISIEISLKFVPKGPVNNIPALVQMVAWRRPGDKPLSEPMMINLLTHICVTRPQWVKPECLCHLVFNLCQKMPSHGYHHMSLWICSIAEDMQLMTSVGFCKWPGFLTWKYYFTYRNMNYSIYDI